MTRSPRSHLITRRRSAALQAEQSIVSTEATRPPAPPRRRFGGRATTNRNVTRASPLGRTLSSGAAASRPQSRTSFRCSAPGSAGSSLLCSAFVTVPSVGFGRAPVIPAMAPCPNDGVDRSPCGQPCGVQLAREPVDPGTAANSRPDGRPWARLFPTNFVGKAFCVARRHHEYPRGHLSRLRKLLGHHGRLRAVFT